jgi:hypothetical protein
MVNVPPSSYDELAELLGDEDQIEQFDEATNTKIVTKRVEEGFQQIITHKEWVNDKIGKRTTTMVRTYKPIVEDEEEVEENVEEEEISDEKLAELRANAPPPPAPVEEEEPETGKDGKKKKKKKKQKLEGASDVIREAFDGGYKEITTVTFPDGTSKKQIRMHYDPVEVPKSETQVVEETTTTKSGKKKKVKKIINVNQEIVESYEDDDGNQVTVAREPFPDGSGHKDITTTKMSNGQYKQTTQIVFYPKEKEIIETTEIIEHEASSIRMKVKETVIKQYHESAEEIEEKSIKKSKKKSSKKQVVEEVVEEDIEDDHHEEQVQEVHIQQVQHVQQENGVEHKKITKKSTKKITEEQKRAELMSRDNSEGVTTVVREKTDKGYREISTTVFADGSSKTQTREFFDAVEETVDHDEAMRIRNNLATLAQQPPQVQKNADGSTSTISIERIANGYRQTTTTKKLNGATSVQTREYYDAVEEETNESGQKTRRVVQSKAQIQGMQNNMMKSVKLFG